MGIARKDTKKRERLRIVAWEVVVACARRYVRAEAGETNGEVIT
jgi:hypothetical protein